MRILIFTNTKDLQIPMKASLVAISLGLFALSVFVNCRAQSPPPSQSKEVVVVIDPGHGGTKNVGNINDRSLSKFNNAWTATGMKQGKEAGAVPDTYEKFLALELSKRIAEHINRKGAQTTPRIVAVLTRTTDENPNMIERAKKARDVGASSFVSIHFNAHEEGVEPKEQGSEAMICSESHGNSKYDLDRKFGVRLAAASERGLKRLVPTLRSRRPESEGLWDDSKLNPVKKGGPWLGSHLFHQLNKFPELARTPACFLEVAFIDNPEIDQKLLKNGKWRETFPVISEEIAGEIVKWHTPK